MRQLSRLLLLCLLLSLLAGPLGGDHAAMATYPGSHNGRLAFGLRANGNMDIVTVLPNGRGFHQLTTAPSFDACAAYSPDGKRIAFCSNRSGTFEIWTMKQDGTEQTQLTHTGGRLLFPDYSPDGQRVAFEGTLPGDTESDIFTMATDGTDLRRLTVGPGDGALPAYSPDGTRIVFISGRSGIPQVWVMDSDGSNPTQLTFDAREKTQVPDWSPDGTRIAYEAIPHIWVMDADGGNQRQLTDGPGEEFGPAWSPDGTKIAFIRYNDGTASQWVHVMDADGSDQYPVYPHGTQAVPAWQPLGGGRLP